MFLRHSGSTPFIANLLCSYFDTVLRAQTPGPESYTTGVIHTSQYNDEDLSLDLIAPVHQTQEVNDLRFGWRTDQFDLNTNHWANPAASLSHHPEPDPQEWLQQPTFALNQSAETSGFPINFENSLVETSTKAVISTELACMENQVRPGDSGTVTDMELEIGDQSPNTSKFRNTAPDSSNLEEPSRLHGVSSSSIYSTEPNASDEVHNPESITEPPQISQYDACFGVVNH